MTEVKTEAAPETATETAAKEKIHQDIADFVENKLGKRLGVTAAKQIFDMSVKAFFTAAVKDGRFRFPAGFGSLEVRHLGVGTKPKRLPSGKTTDATLKEGRVKLRYHEGVSVRELLGTNKAKKASTEVAQPEAAAPASV